MTDEKKERARQVFDRHGPVFKTKTLRDHKLFSRDIGELLSDGLIRKVKAGYYVWASAEQDMSDLELAASIIPGGIICLQSAAFYYDLSTLNPIVVTIAVPSNCKRPVLPSSPPVELAVTPPRLFELGLTEEDGAYGKLRIYDKERTVCDFFKMRKQLGDDLALEVLKSYMSGKRRLQLLFDYAGQMRIKTVMKPYVEALT